MGIGAYPSGMAEPFYEKLSSLDASFLALESRSAHMHVAGVTIFDAGPLMEPEGGIDVDLIRAHVASKLAYIPRYRQRLSFVPFEGSPVWIDDEQFNFDYHVRHTSLPKPGSDEQLKKLAGRIVSQQLDRAKPLWELWLVEGLEGDRFAMIGKVHHCMIDGIASVDLMAILLNLAPIMEVETSPPWTPRPAPTATQLFVAEAAKGTRKAIDTMTHVRQMVASGKLVTQDTVKKIGAAANSLRSGWLTTAPKTPLNTEIGPNRRFDWFSQDLAGVKSVKNALGGSVNDVVLATVAGAIRHFLAEHRDFDVDTLEFRVMAPVSVRTQDQAGDLGNQVAMWLVQLPVSEADPVGRLKRIQDETLHLKKSGQALGATTLVQVATGGPATLVSLATRLASAAARPFNMTVTNVPGPQFPLYLLGARMTEQYPIVPLWAQHGVGIALFSYDGKLFWGIHADWDALPDIEAFKDSIKISFRELADAARATA
jgi:WS/DGAT/MGAT family acyltransferase